MLYRTYGRRGWPVSEIDYDISGIAGWTGSENDPSFSPFMNEI